MRARNLAVLFGATALFAASLAAGGCDLVRSSACKDNESCVKMTDGGAPVCYDMRCVECAYDVDCPSGKVCNSAKSCESLDKAAEATGESSRDGGADQPTKWEGSNWDECAKDCKDQDCLHACDTKFPRPSPSGSAAAKPPKK